MLEKVKTKAKEIINKDGVLFKIELVSIVSVGLIGMYFIGRSDGLKIGVEATGKAMTDLLTGIAENAKVMA